MPFLLCQPGKAQSRVRGEPPQRPCAPSTPAQGAPPPIGRLAECSGSCKEVHAFPLTVSAPAAQVPPPCVSRDGRWDWRQTVRCPSLKGQVCVRGRVYLCVSIPFPHFFVLFCFFVKSGLRCCVILGRQYSSWRRSRVHERTGGKSPRGTRKGSGPFPCLWSLAFDWGGFLGGGRCMP